MDGLLTAPILSNTRVTFPTTIYQPNDDWFGDDSGVVKETFSMNIVQTDFIHLNVFSSSTSTSDVYFTGVTQEKLVNLDMPNNLNFGNHKIQTLNDETWVATLDGKQDSEYTTGSVSYSDTTLDQDIWQIKVEQVDDWLNKKEDKYLTGAKLSIFGSDVVQTGFLAEDIHYALGDAPVTLETGVVTDLLSVNTAGKRGDISFVIDKFELFVPKNQPKKIGNMRLP